MRITIFLILGLLIMSCDNDSKLEKEIAKIKSDFVVERFDLSFLEANPNDLPRLKNTYPFLFSPRINDSVWISRLNDSLQNELLNEVKNSFADFTPVKEEIKSLFQHLKYYDKTFDTPRVISLTNDVDYRNKTIVTDTIVLIALDNYLGKNHMFYQNIPKYLSVNMTKSQIVPDLATEYAKRYTYQSSRKTFLDEMIYFGKLLYFKDIMLPYETNADKIGYTMEQIDWAQDNESAIWSYFIEKELLFSTDSKLPNRFIADAPYSKFYLELDNESPGRLGQYIGWQIVRAFAANTDKSMQKILQTEPEELFRESKYKPKK